MFEKKVEAFLSRHSISLNQKKLVIGVSGGPDSLALLHYLATKREQWQLNLLVAHVDHMFRGEESYQEAMFVKAFCAEINVPFEWKQINVEVYMEKTGKSAQVAARDCRFEFFSEMMKKFDAHYLVLGHHGDDQIETMLMRLTRGSSGKARAGIPFKRHFGAREIIRPLLSVNKQDIENYCSLNRLHPRRDPSNEKPIYSRNRFRTEVIPFLKSENSKVDEHFQRFSEELYEDEIFLEELTRERMNTVMESRNDNGITIDINKLIIMPIPLQRRTIQLILNYLYEARPASLSAVHIDLIFSLFLNSQPSGKLDFPKGLQIVKSYHRCHFQFEHRNEQSYQFEMLDPGTLALPNGSTVTFEYVKNPMARQEENVFVLDPKEITLPLIIRTRRNGDRINPKGMRGTKKIKDIFIDLKVPQSVRAVWPIITDNSGTIIWIPGIKKSNFEVSNHKQGYYLLLTYKKHGII